MPDNLFRSKAADMVLLSYLKEKAVAERQRQKAASDRLAIYHDDWDDILETILANQFLENNYSKIRLLKNKTQNILKKVVNDISVVYNVAPSRDHGDNETMKEIYEYLEIDEFMKKVNRYSSLLNDVLLRVGWDEELERITLDIQTPANSSIIQRDNYPEQAAAVYYEIDYIDDQFKAMGKRFVFWSDFEHFLFDEKGNIFPVEGNEEKINPYGKLPFVIIHLNQLPGMFWNATQGNDLVDGTTITGFKRTLKDYLFKVQSFKQLWFRMQKGEVAPEMALDPLSAFRLTGENSEVGVLELTAQFEALENTMQADINSFLATYGLSVDMFAVSGEEASGRALKIKNRGLRDIREAQLPVFRRIEGDLFDMIRMVYNYNKGKGKIPESIEFKIDFAEMETYVEPMEKRKQADHDVSKGLMSPGQYYMMFNPDITDEEEAEQKLSENLLKYKNMANQGFSFESLFGQDKKETPDVE